MSVNLLLHKVQKTIDNCQTFLDTHKKNVNLGDIEIVQLILLL